jgi:hypothetical protein
VRIWYVGSTDSKQDVSDVEGLAVNTEPKNTLGAAERPRAVAPVGASLHQAVAEPKAGSHHATSQQLRRLPPAALREPEQPPTPGGTAPGAKASDALVRKPTAGPAVRGAAALRELADRFGTHGVALRFADSDADISCAAPARAAGKKNHGKMRTIKCKLNLGANSLVKSSNKFYKVFLLISLELY